MNACIKLGCLIGFACAMATPAFAGEEKVVLMLGGKFCDGYVGMSNMGCGEFPA